MQLRFDDCDYTLTGTPAEIYEFMTLDESQAPAPIESVPKPESKKEAPAPAPKPEKKPKPRKEIDWPKAKALRDAGWSYEKIGDELHCSAQNVANHLKAEGEKERES